MANGTTTLLDFRGKLADPATGICERYGNKPDALLEIFHDLQDEAGHVPETSLSVIAKALNLSRAEVYGVASFYHDFHLKPVGRHVIKLCRAEACQAMGGRDLQAMVEKLLGITMGSTTADGRITLEGSYCLGLCAASPAMMVDGKPVARVDAGAFANAIAGLA